MWVGSVQILSLKWALKGSLVDVGGGVPQNMMSLPWICGDTVCLEAFTDLSLRSKNSSCNNFLQDPESRCRSLGFCISTGNEIRDPTREATPVKTPASGQIIVDSPVCTICKFVVGKIDEMLKNNATKVSVSLV